MTRKKLNISTNFSVADILDQMSEGSIAARQISKLFIRLFNDAGIAALINIDDMNIRGEQLCYAFEFCGGNIDMFDRSKKIELSADDVKNLIETLKRLRNYASDFKSESKNNMALAVNIRSARAYVKGELPFKASFGGTATMSYRPKIAAENIDIFRSQQVPTFADNALQQAK